MFSTSRSSRQHVGRYAYHGYVLMMTAGCLAVPAPSAAVHTQAEFTTVGALEMFSPHRRSAIAEPAQSQVAGSAYFVSWVKAAK